MPTVLLVDDEPVLRSVISEYLKFSGYDVADCPDSGKAMARLRAGGIDIVVSDVLMPGADGLEFCRAIRGDASIAGVPFLFMTARSVDAEMQAEMDRLADACVFKPFEPDALLETMRAAINAKS